MLDELGLRIRDVVLSEIDLSKELSDEEICDLIGMAVSKEAREIPMTLRQRADLERIIFNSLRKLDILQELVDDKDVTEIMVNGPNEIFMKRQAEYMSLMVIFHRRKSWRTLYSRLLGAITE